MRPQPYFMGGSLRGYRVYPGRNRAQFASLGLQPGDLVMAVNGAALDDPNRGLEILRGIGQGGAVTLTVERGGQQQQITVDPSSVVQQIQAQPAPAPAPEAEDATEEADEVTGMRTGERGTDSMTLSSAWPPLLACVLPLAAAGQQGAQITPNYKDADIGQVIEAVSQVTGKNFIVDPRVRAQVTMLSNTPMSPDAFYRGVPRDPAGVRLCRRAFRQRDQDPAGRQCAPGAGQRPAGSRQLNVRRDRDAGDAGAERVRRATRSRSCGR